MNSPQSYTGQRVSSKIAYCYPSQKISLPSKVFLKKNFLPSLFSLIHYLLRLYWLLSSFLAGNNHYFYLWLGISKYRKLGKTLFLPNIIRWGYQIPIGQRVKSLYIWDTCLILFGILCFKTFVWQTLTPRRILFVIDSVTYSTFSICLGRHIYPYVIESFFHNKLENLRPLYLDWKILSIRTLMPLYYWQPDMGLLYSG